MMDAQLFRLAMSRFATGVTVVTSRHGDEIQGMTVNSLTSVSLEPPLVLFCAAHETRTLSLIERSGVYAVNVLEESQLDLCTRFASRSNEQVDRFAGLEYTDGRATGCPLFADTLATLECRLVTKVPAGDHVILVAQVESLECRDGRPLLFYARSYFQLA